MQLQNQKKIRTTIEIPVWLHRKFKMEAARRNKTISQIILADCVEEDSVGWEVFDEVAESGPQFDAARVVRNQRDLQAKKYGKAGN